PRLLPYAHTARTVPGALGARAASPPAATALTRRVAPGDRSPGAPTDPDVRISRIRLVESRFRRGVDAVHDSRTWQWVALEQLVETLPVHARVARAAVGR